LVLSYLQSTQASSEPFLVEYFAMHFDRLAVGFLLYVLSTSLSLENN